MFRLAALAAAFTATAAVAAPVPKDLKKKEATLDGAWEVVEWHSNGNKVNNSVVMKWVIDGQNLTIERNNKALGGAVRVASNVTYSLVKPEGGAANALDYTLTYANGGPAPRVLPGVFELDGDSLKFCYAPAANGERPAECKAAQGNVMYLFKRADAK